MRTAQRIDLPSRMDALTAAYERLLERFREGTGRNLIATPLPFESLSLTSFDAPAFGPARIEVSILVHRADAPTLTFAAGSLEGALDAWFASDAAIVGAR